MKTNPMAPPGSDANPVCYRFPPDYFYDPLYDWQQDVEFDTFWLVFPTFGPMTAALAQQQSVNIPNDSDFECRNIRYHTDTAAGQIVVAAVIVPNVTIQILDGGSGRNLLNAPAPLACIASPESMPPIPFPWPKIFTRNSTITITLTNFDAAVATNNFRVIMTGRKIFTKQT